MGQAIQTLSSVTRWSARDRSASAGIVAHKRRTPPLIGELASVGRLGLSTPTTILVLDEFHVQVGASSLPSLLGIQR